MAVPSCAVVITMIIHIKVKETMEIMFGELI
jgi:hypothetical protein